LTSRRFNKRIEVYENAAVSDNFGGSTVSETLVATVWADLKTMDKGAVTDIGYTDALLGVNCLVRKPDTFDYKTENMFIRYGGNDYTIVSYTEDINFKHRYIRFMAITK